MAKPSKLALIGFLLVCLCFGARIGYAQTFSDTFEKLYAEMKDAMSRRDTNAVAALLAPGFVSEDISGKVQSAEQMLVELSGLPQDANKKSQTTLLSVDIRGNIANVTQRYHMNTTKVTAGGDSKAIELNAVSNDTWKLIDGSWRQVRTVTRQLDYIVNGKALVHKTHESN